MNTVKNNDGLKKEILIYKLVKIKKFFFGCAGSLLLCWLFLAAVSRGHLIVAQHRLLLVVSSFAAEHAF